MKDALDSRTVYGLLVLALGPFLAKYGIDDAMLQGIAQAIAVIGGVWAAWSGRQRATQPIGSVAGIKLPSVMIPKTQPVEVQPEDQPQ